MRSLIRNLRVLAISCVAFAIGFSFVTLVDGRPSTPPPPAPELVGDSSEATHLIKRHDCWTGDAPADMVGQIPGHVIATPRRAVTPVRGGDAMVSKAFEQIFDGIDHGLTVHAFCR